MKNCLMTCALVLGLAGFANAGEPNTEAAEVRAELVELKHLLQLMQDRIERLEQRLIALDNRSLKRLPWQREQPFLWDAIERPQPGPSLP